MTNKKTTDQMIERIKYFINSIENGEYAPRNYEFTFSLSYSNGKKITVSDSFTSSENEQNRPSLH